MCAKIHDDIYGGQATIEYDKVRKGEYGFKIYPESKPNLVIEGFAEKTGSASREYWFAGIDHPELENRIEGSAPKDKTRGGGLSDSTREGSIRWVMMRVERKLNQDAINTVMEAANSDNQRLFEKLEKEQEKFIKAIEESRYYRKVMFNQELLLAEKEYLVGWSDRLLRNLDKYINPTPTFRDMKRQIKSELRKTKEQVRKRSIENFESRAEFEAYREWWSYLGKYYQICEERGNTT